MPKRSCKDVSNERFADWTADNVTIEPTAPRAARKGKATVTVEDQNGRIVELSGHEAEGFQAHEARYRKMTNPASAAYFHSLGDKYKDHPIDQPVYHIERPSSPVETPDIHDSDKSIVKNPKGKTKKRRKNPAAVALGRKGGLRGGKTRAAKMTPEERSEAARKAVQARWAKQKARSRA